MKVFNNVTDIVRDDIAFTMKKGSKVSIAAAFKVNKYYHTDWLAEEELPVKLDGLDIDTVYENFVRQIAGDKLQIIEAGESLKNSVARDEEIQVLKKQIDALQMKIRKEKQLNKQMEMNTELKKLRNRLEKLR
jgi:SMC interacting uncharacterized protein involved in chromosome segregation